MDQGNYTGVLFLDFKKVFDMVNRTILLSKLKVYKLDDLSLNWLMSDMELDEKCIVVSSAYKSDILWPTQRGKSFIYKRKSKGPSMLLIKYKLIHPNQSGFRSKHSCVTALTKIADHILIEMDQGNYTRVLFLDFNTNHLT
jgi:hypothetical protein